MVAGKENIRGCNLNRLASSFHRNFGAKPCRLFLAESGRNQWRPYRSWSYSINAYSSVYKLKGKSPGERHNGTFCGCVVQQLWTPLICYYGGRVDYGTPFSHVLHSMPTIENKISSSLGYYKLAIENSKYKRVNF
ncbi:hypothetical protein TorRG33x02_332450 [Trema orientale]|uniref:Uncharacterized protein n=1 Tax=Trema orientale TaxID=63057 RepID=A0A2P5B5A0_TREOI|nr:hypothetical protein TorRG33x02_332450 [Trema orientale]